MMHPLTKAFRALKKKDYYAERDDACCRSCALAALPEKFHCLHVFTTMQDEEDLMDKGECYISWAAPEDSPDEIIEELLNAGLTVVHDGSVNTRILIRTNEKENMAYTARARNTV